MGFDLFTLVELVALVAAIGGFFSSSAGKRIGRYLPVPFWVYFLSIVLGSVGVLPRESDVYGWVGLHLLPAALVLMLIGAPVSSLLRIGPRALAALGLASGSMFAAVVGLFPFFARFLGDEGWRVAGSLLATWTGGSANMLAVKEIVGLSDEGIGPLIIADTVLSYSWFALLIAAVAMERWYDRGGHAREEAAPPVGRDRVPPGDRVLKLGVVLVSGFAAAEVTVWGGAWIAAATPLLTATAWTILLATTGGVALALTPASRLESYRASDVGTFLLYVVLASMGARTSLDAAVDAPAVLLFGLAVLTFHGAILFFVGRALKIPLFLVATASQASVGGPVSAPIVAGVYRPGGAPLGVLMAIAGAVAGTYIGSFGGGLCRLIARWIGV